MNPKIEFTIKVPKWHKNELQFDAVIYGKDVDPIDGNYRLGIEIYNKILDEKTIITSYDKEELENAASQFIRLQLHEMRSRSFDEILSYGLLLDADDLLSLRKCYDLFDENDPAHKLKSLLESLTKPTIQEYPEVEMPEVRSLREPKIEDYVPTYSMLDKTFSTFRRKKDTAAEVRFEAAHTAWRNKQQTINEIMQKYQNKISARELNIENQNAAQFEYEEKVQEIAKQISSEHEQWLERKKNYYHQRDESNKTIDYIKDEYANGDPESLCAYFRILIEESKFPIGIPKGFQIEYNASTKSVIIELTLPNTEQTPQAVVVLSKGSSKTKELSASSKKKIYESTIYQIILRVVYVVFTGDHKDAIEAITINGWIHSVDRSTGNPYTSCITSLHITNPVFLLCGHAA